MNYKNLCLILIALFLASCAKEPVASFTASTTNPDVNEEVSFTNTSTEATSYQWEFGDGATSTSENPTHTYTTEGSFTVELTAKNDAGSSSASTTILASYPDPIAGFTMDKSLAEPGEVITFTNTSEHATSYSWDFGDGATSTSENPVHIYAEEGTYTVQLKATGLGGATNTATNTATINYADPVAGFTMDKTEAAPLEVITFTNTSENASSYMWDFGDGETSTVTDPTHAYETEGTFTIQLTAVGPGGATNSSSATLTTTWGDPVAGFTMDKTEAAPQEDITFTNESENAESYVWDFGDGSTSTVTNPIYSYDSEGTFTVQLVATGYNTETSSISKEVTIAWPDPVADFSMDKNPASMYDLVTFTNLSEYAESYSWDFGDGSTSTDENPTHSFSAEGTFSVQLTATGPGGTDLISRDITITAPVPVADFSMDIVDDKADLDQLITFTNLSEYADSYSWDFGDGSTSTDENPTHSYSEGGVFTVQLTATGSGGTSSVSKDVSVVEVNIFPGVGALDIELDETWGVISSKLGDWVYGGFVIVTSTSGSYIIHFVSSASTDVELFLISVSGSTTLLSADICIQVNCGSNFVGMTDEGIGIGNTLTELEAAYGAPEVIDDQYDVYRYRTLGISFYYDASSEIDQIAVYTPWTKKSTGIYREILEQLDDRLIHK